MMLKKAIAINHWLILPLEKRFINARKMTALQAYIFTKNSASFLLNTCYPTAELHH